MPLGEVRASALAQSLPAAGAPTCASVTDAFNVAADFVATGANPTSSRPAPTLPTHGRAGDTVDFVIGPGDSVHTYDAMALDARVCKAPGGG